MRTKGDKAGSGADDDAAFDPRRLVLSVIKHRRPPLHPRYLIRDLSKPDRVVNRGHSPPSTGGDRPFSFIGS
jgi:hypothetical protein